jgi:hypothetical protein
MSDSAPPPINPYQSPVSATEFFPGPVIGDFFRDGKFLVCRDRAELPMRCLINGETVTPDAWRKRKQISWNPPWIFIGILGGLLPVLILMLIAQKKAHIVYSLGKLARSRMRNRQLIGIGLLVAFGLLLAAGISKTGNGSNGGVLVIPSIFTLILGLIILIKASPLKISGHRKGWFKMKGVSQDFLNELPEGDWKRI